MIRMREACGRIRLYKVPERFNNSVGDWIIRALRRAIVLDFVDAIRLESGDGAGYQLPREEKRFFDNAGAHDAACRQLAFNVGSDAATAIKDPACGCLHGRAIVHVLRRRGLAQMQGRPRGSIDLRS